MLRKKEVITSVFTLAMVAISFRYPILAAVGTAAFVATQIMSPINLLLFYIIWYPFTYLEYFSAYGIRVDSILTAIVAAIAIVSFPMERLPSSQSLLAARSGRLIVNIGLMICFSTGVLGSSLFKGEELSRWIMSIGSVLSFIIPILLIKSEDDFQSVIAVLKVSAFILAMSGILSSFQLLHFEHFQPKYSYDSPFSGIFGATGLMASRGGFGVFMAFVLPFVYLSLSTSLKNGKRGSFRELIALIGHLLLLVALLASILFSVSRATWLMAATETVLYLGFVFASRKGVRKTLVFLVPIGLVFLVVSYGLLERAFKDVYMIRAQSVNMRFAKDIAALDSIMEHPIFGITQAQAAYVGGMDIEIHNMFLDIASEGGIISVIPVLFLFLLTFKMLFPVMKNPDEETRKIGACLMIGFVGMLINLQCYAGWDKHIWLFLGVINVFCLIAYRKGRVNSGWQRANITAQKYPPRTGSGLLPGAGRPAHTFTIAGERF